MDPQIAQILVLSGTFSSLNSLDEPAIYCYNQFSRDSIGKENGGKEPPRQSDPDLASEHQADVDRDAERVEADKAKRQSRNDSDASRDLGRADVGRSGAERQAEGDERSLGKAVIATGYSGNVDFTSEDTCFVVPYKLIPVQKDSYPYWQSQQWADADDEAATNYMLLLIDNPDTGGMMGRRARRHIQLKASYRSTGLRYLDRIRRIQADVSRKLL